MTKPKTLEQLRTEKERAGRVKIFSHFSLQALA